MRSIKQQFENDFWPAATGPFVVIREDKKSAGYSACHSPRNRDGPLIFHLAAGPPNVTGPPGGTGPPPYPTGSGPPEITGQPMEWLVNKSAEETLKTKSLWQGTGKNFNENLTQVNKRNT